MEEKRTVQEEIEESLRICEELLNDNPDIISERPDIDLEKILDETHDFVEPDKEKTVRAEEQPTVQNIRPLEITYEEVPSEKMKPDKKTVEKIDNVPKKSVETKTKKRSIVRTLISFLVCIAIAVAAAFLITHYVANHTTVEGSSMEPCLGNGDELIVEKISYLTGKPERFDVVVFKFNETTNYIKRIIGLPGEDVRIEEGKIYINDKAIFDEHANGVMEDPGIAEETVSLGADEYFVLGDNRNASKDSRNKDVGVVKGDHIIGKAWLRMMPFDDFGIIQ